MDLLSDEVVYDGYSKIKKMSFFNPSTKKEFSRELLSRGSSVTLLLFDPENKLFLMANEFRIGEFTERSESSGLVAGMIEDGENYAQVASREALEESGVVINESGVKLLTKAYNSPGITDEVSYLCYCATDLTKVDTEKVYGLESEAESIRISIHSYDELKGFISSGRLSVSALSLLMALSFDFQIN